MFPFNNFQNNYPNMNFNPMNYPMINNMPNQMNSNMNIQNQMFNQMYQAQGQINNNSNNNNGNNNNNNNNGNNNNNNINNDNNNSNNDNDVYDDKVDFKYPIEAGFLKMNDDFLSQITDPKKKLYISNNEEKKEIIIPIYFTKNELYSYLKCFGENIIIFYNNNILKDDSTSIEDIPNDSTLLLFSIPHIHTCRESSLYKYILSLYPNDDKCNVICENKSDNNCPVFFLPLNIPIYQMIILIRKVLNLDDNIIISRNGLNINENNNSKLKEILAGDLNYTTLKLFDSRLQSCFGSFTGKRITAIIFLKNKEEFKSIAIYKYDPICKLYNRFNNGEISKIFFNGLLISKDDHRSLASFGINNDFFCCIAE